MNRDRAARETRAVSVDDLRRFAVGRSLFRPTSLKRALEILGFVQADPIRAPARAQDLILRHRVRNYRAGDLERLYATLEIEEDVFINYGFVTRSLHALMHPRANRSRWSTARMSKAHVVYEFVRDRGTVHPRDVDAHFARGRVTNYWGGSSSATTHLLDLLHYRGALRIARRERGIRIYAARDRAAGPVDAVARRRQIDALVDAAVHLYAPLPTASLSGVVSRLRYAVPQWRGELKAALGRAKLRLAHVWLAGTDWYWPAAERVLSAAPQHAVRLLAPSDPVVWDRRRFEMLWDWPYRFEAYTPVHKRKLGYYALPLLYRDRVIGWGNASVNHGKLHVDIGFADSSPARDRTFKRELDAELDRLRVFLGADVA